MDKQKLLKKWLEIGNANPWISAAYDPPFNEDSFCFYDTIEEFANKILEYEWCLGSAFIIGNICFINQTNGDEYKVIKGETPFESITLRRYNESIESAKERLIKFIERVNNATEEQCKHLEY